MQKLLEKHFILIFFLPTMVLSALLILYPMGYGFYVSLFDTNLVNKWDFVGLRNYSSLLTNKSFHQSLLINLQYIVAVVAGHFLVGTVLALLLNKHLKARTFFRCLLMLPWLIPEVVFAILFKWILNPQYGIFNFTLMDLGLLDSPLTWLGDATLGLPTVIVISIIKGYPFAMIMVLSALQTVSPDIYEAAEMDGCGPVAAFFRITLPAILPVLTVALILDTVNWFKHYTMVNILTGGGPANTTSLVSINIYKTAFTSFKFGQAGAMAVVVFVICYAFGWVYRRVSDEKE